MDDFESRSRIMTSLINPSLKVTVVKDLKLEHFADGLAAAWGPEQRYLVTSPNVRYIPEIVDGIVSVHVRRDGTFGVHDPIQWPQIFSSKYPYLVAVPKGLSPLANAETAPFPPSALWTRPSQDIFEPLPNTPVRMFGLFREDFLDSLEPLVLEMSSRARQYSTQQCEVDLQPLQTYERDMLASWVRVRQIPATFRDQVVQLTAVRRSLLLCAAFMSYYDLLDLPPSATPRRVDHQLMGTWTSEPQEAQRLMSLGVPVWFVRAPHLISTKIRVASFMPVLSSEPLCQEKVHGLRAVYQGLAGPRHLKASLSCPVYAEISHLPTANILNPDDYTASSSSQSCQYHGRASGLHLGARQNKRGSGARRHEKAKIGYSPYGKLTLDRSKNAHPTQTRGRDKFVDIQHPWMPAALPSWERAMRAVDRSTRMKPHADIWGYWIPEPALVVGPQDPARLQRYVLNWLRAQPVWLYMLQIPGSGVVKVSTQSWRNFLNGVPENMKTFTRSGKCAYEIKQIFGRVFSETELDPEAEGEVQWHRRRLSKVDDRTGRQVVWENFELGFRYELWALDRAMRPMETQADEVNRILRLARVFPSNSLWVVSKLPTEDSGGLFAALPHRRIPFLNAFRDILKLWALCPPAIKDAAPLRTGDSVEAIEELELWMALFYTQTFFDAAGRAPIVPHCFPYDTT